MKRRTVKEQLDFERRWAMNATNGTAEGYYGARGVYKKAQEKTPTDEDKSSSDD